MIRKLVIRAVIVALAGAVTAEAVELAVADLIIPLDGTGTLVVSGSIAGDETFGLTIVLEISSRAGNIGTVEFTNAPPVDIVQLGDPGRGLESSPRSTLTRLGHPYTTAPSTRTARVTPGR